MVVVVVEYLRNGRRKFISGPQRLQHRWLPCSTLLPEQKNSSKIISLSFWRQLLGNTTTTTENMATRHTTLTLNY